MSFAYKVGHDAEFFVTSAKDLSTVIPVCGLVGGTKEKPRPLEGSKVGTTVQEDGVALELGMSPVHFRDFGMAASTCVQEVSKMATTLGLCITSGSVNTFKEEQLTPHPQAFVMGCLPDRDAWVRGEARAPFPVEMFGCNRFTGGHLHFSYECEGSGQSHRAMNGTPTWAIVKLLDALALYNYSNYNAVHQGERYKFYGKPGLYRNKPYGLEYRTPTNEVLYGNSFTSTDIVGTCAVIVQACAELTTHQIRSVYDSIPWDKVEKGLRIDKFSYKQRQAMDGGLGDCLYEIYVGMADLLGEPR